ncbi:AbiH family protein [Peribacillus simplex]|uniref:AbiH family protein n=1 Tax=Peribacillus simplex TaxID=1478 RepID=UPI00366C7865
MKKGKVKDTILIIGNGIAWDFHNHFENFGLNPSKPISNFDSEDINLDKFLDYIPNVRKQLLTVENKNKKDHFKPIEDYFNSINGTPDFFRRENELKNFLMVAYAHFQLRADKFDYSTWRWTKFLSENAKRIVLAVSFNYDLLLERAIGTSNTYNRISAIEPPGNIKIFKPHGSIDLDLIGIQIENFDPRIHEVYGNNSDSLGVVLSHNWKKPRMQVDTIPPNLHNYYRNKRMWLDNAYKECDKLTYNNRIRHVVIAGHSYGEVDREEVNELLCNLTRKARFYFVNPEPMPEPLKEYIKSLNMHHEICHIDPRIEEQFNGIMNQLTKC